MATVIVCAGILVMLGCAGWFGYCLGRAAECDARAKAAERRSADEALAEARKARTDAAAKLTEINALIDRLRDRAEWIDRHPDEFYAAVNGASE